MADSIFPNFLRINADGSIGAIFSGGLELNQGDSYTPPLEDALTWLAPNDQRDSTGNYPAQIFSSFVTLGNGDKIDTLQLSQSAVRANGPNDLAEAVLAAYNFNGAGQPVSITARAAPTIGDSNSGVSAATDRYTVDIINDDGSSTFAWQGSGAGATSNKNASGTLGPGGWYGIQSAGITLKNPRGSRIMMIASCSGYASAVGTTLDFALGYDGTPVVDCGTFYFNIANTHMAFPMVAYLTPTLPAGYHTPELWWSISGGSVTISNVYDLSAVAAWEVP